MDFVRLFAFDNPAQIKAGHVRKRLVDDDDGRSAIFEPGDRGTCSGQQMRGKTYASEPLEETPDLNRFMSNDQNIFVHRSNPVTLLKQYRLSKKRSEILLLAGTPLAAGEKYTHREKHRTEVTEVTERGIGIGGQNCSRWTCRAPGEKDAPPRKASHRGHGERPAG